MPRLLLSLLLVVTLAVLAVAEEFSFNLADLEKELGYFGSCKGKKINYPAGPSSKGLAAVAVCIPEVKDVTKKQEKACIGLCVAQKLKYVTDEGLYDFDEASEPLRQTIDNPQGTDQKNDKEAVETQLEVLRECSEGKRFTYKDDCITSVEFDKCIRKGAAEKCGAKKAD